MSAQIEWKEWIRSPRNPHLVKRPQHFIIEDVLVNNRDSENGGTEVIIKVCFRHTVDGKSGFVVADNHRIICNSRDDAASIVRLFRAANAGVTSFEPPVQTGILASGVNVLLTPLVLPPNGSPEWRIENLTEKSLRSAASKFICDRFCEKEPLTFTLIASGTLRSSEVAQYIESCMVSAEVSGLSLALLDDAGAIMGAAMNEILPETEESTSHEPVIPDGMTPVVKFLTMQDRSALEYCNERLIGFREAWQKRLVGHHMMVAGASVPGAEEAFRSSMQVFRGRGLEFVIVEATNPWTVSQCEKYKALAVHTLAFKDFLVSDASGTSCPIGPADQASVFYVLRL